MSPINHGINIYPPEIPPQKKTRTCASMNDCSETVKFTQLMHNESRNHRLEPPNTQHYGYGPPQQKKTHHQQRQMQPGGRYRIFSRAKKTTHGAHHWSSSVLLPPISGAPSYTGSQNSSCSGPSVLPASVAVRPRRPKCVSAMITVTSEALEGFWWLGLSAFPQVHLGDKFKAPSRCMNL